MARRPQADASHSASSVGLMRSHIRTGWTSNLGQAPCSVSSSVMHLVNRTRYSPSIPRRLLKQTPYLLPLYYLARLSDLAREGMENSGSYHFADHIYAGRASGRYGIGTIVDRALLSLPACRSFRNRYIHSRDRIVDYVRSAAAKECRILSVPSGLPRDLVEAAAVLRNTRTRFYGLDIDPAVLQEARDMTAT